MTENRLEPGYPTSPWWVAFLSRLLTLPGGVAILFALVLLGMFLGVVPSTMSTKIDEALNRLDMTRQDHVQIRQQLQDLATANNNNLALQTRLLRGICLIMAKTQAQQISNCNP